ncbi:MAG: type I-E CRISPR-associated protein Cas7/Cse4/CasC [Planctomycetes bacterium]|nr:type I-E CRISPR-associated protein Cas7/Cse4/CasC [Planctomycetota bacterium]
MLIEIHMIQNHSPANLNRDDLGAPKTCLFGGVTRARISSQCLKRSIRRSADFQKAMEKDGGIRTRSLIREIAKRAHGNGEPPENLVKRIQKVFIDGGIGVSESGGDETATDILFFVTNSAIQKMAEAFAANSNDLNEKIADILGEAVRVPDIALAGRMTEFKAKDHFRHLDFTVEAALATAHAFSTHEVINEVDYFTAVDDLATGTGAGHVNEAMFASACFYKHFCIDWNQLVTNLGGDVALATTTVRQFLLGAALSTPSGKQKSFAAFNPPEGILLEIKTEHCVPMSYANAFADPVPPKSARGLIGESIARLGQHVHEMAVGYGLAAQRFWFSPAKRHSLTWIDREEKRESAKEKPVVDADASFGRLDDLVSGTMAAVTAGTEHSHAGAVS